MENLKISKILDSLIKKYPNPERSDLGKLLSDAQTEFGYLSEFVIRKISNHVGVSATEAFGYASFYSMYYLQKPGKYIVRVCKGTACHVKGARKLIENIESFLKIKEGEITKDGLFQLEVASCLGVCALSPVMMVNEETYSRISFSSAKKILTDIRRKEVEREEAEKEAAIKKEQERETHSESE